MKTIAVIPARLGSTRLPRKPLADIGGVPMIVRVIERVREARGLHGLLVATDSEEIASVATKAGVETIMTPSDCESGTDRVAWAVRELGATLDADLILNIQGDEPLLPPKAVEDLADTLRSAVGRGVELATLARPLVPAPEESADEDASGSSGESDGLVSPQVVKVVLDEAGDALYFSRSPIPFAREPGLVRPLAHVGLYGYTRGALARVASLAPTRLEQAEGLEQLRALGHGMRMAVRVGPYRSVAVDTPEDLARVRSLWGTPAA